jgi:hypothetical protein
MSTTVSVPTYTASATITIAPENIATSSTFAAGVESTVVSNLSTKYSDAWVSGKWTAGTTPTANTQVQIWVYAPISDDLSSAVVYPDVLDGTSSAETMTSTGVLQGGLKLAAILNVDSNTSNREYPCAPFSIASLFGGRIPTRWGLFIAHNSGVNSNSTAGNHVWTFIGITDGATTT